MAFLNPISPSDSIVVGISTVGDGLSANESNNSVFCRNSVIRSNETLAKRQDVRERAKRLNKANLASCH